MEKKHDLNLLIEAIAKLDAFLSISVVASLFTTKCMPLLKNSKGAYVEISTMKHPFCYCRKNSQNFVANSMKLDFSNKTNIMSLSGPNMGGKSTVLRQIGLITILAQIGSFVPASFMEFTPFKKIFTQMGNYDDLSQGKSTFMVEMLHCTKFFKNLDTNMLILVDELGRGTDIAEG